MAIRNSPLCLKRPVEDTTPNVEHRRLLALTREVVVEGIVRAVWTVIECVAHRLGFGYASYVWGYTRDLRCRTLMDGPP